MVPGSNPLLGHSGMLSHFTPFQANDFSNFEVLRSQLLY